MLDCKIICYMCLLNKQNIWEMQVLHDILIMINMINELQGCSLTDNTLNLFF